ncbi:hypothetical protein [Rummeliibacillus sp. POC4]|uniref:hypothetical protein n=1 Tax=Rummeliibacillus sp. POC4 TaxID=2305899 RepID=UPI000E672847|nr:hypothetical protein [Rummeliibacillus sp. POC4]RIJ63200.1 hypothetical protein D1606_16240 [Rummeliibacillus sp. POC4]
MNHLTEKDVSSIKYEIKNGRLTLSGIRTYLIGLFFYSGFTVGLAFFVANANTVGWENLSRNWHILFILEAILFAIHALALLLCRGNNNINQKILMVCIVVFTYKTALDPFLTMTMFFKDRDVYKLYIPIVIFIILAGFIIHILILTKWVKGLKLNRNNEKKTIMQKSVKWSFIFFILVIFTLIIQKGLLGNLELLFGIFIFTVLYIAFLIGVCEFIIATYCVFRFPSFVVNPPSQKKSQYVNPKNERKKKKRKKK